MESINTHYSYKRYRYWYRRLTKLPDNIDAFTADHYKTIRMSQNIIYMSYKKAFELNCRFEPKDLPIMFNTTNLPKDFDLFTSEEERFIIDKLNCLRLHGLLCVSSSNARRN